MHLKLPIDDALSDLKHALAHNRCVVLEAPPGAGKTTRVPLVLLEETWLGRKKIIMLEPRRVAARAAATRMASTMKEDVGQTIGYRVRLDSKVSVATRIEVLTEGLLVRRLNDDPELADTALLIFDEFHERSLNADLSLALALDAQSALNENLKILVMSATLDGARVSRLLGDAPIVRSEGKLFPIETVYAPPSAHQRSLDAAASMIHRAASNHEGGILVFLPGEGEIRALTKRLTDDPIKGARIFPLYGNLTPAEQDLAIRPTLGGERKIVLATSIAETSLTIEDIRIVIDMGEQRLARFDPASGMTRLVTQRVSLASADQRRGRCGRIAPGVCFRLWEEAETRALLPHTPPEILTADLAPFALDLAAWGVADPSQLRFMDQPQASVFAEAQTLLKELEAIDQDARITPHGRELLRFGAHPRLAHMMVKARDLGETATATALAAVLTERDVLRTSSNNRDADMRSRLEVMAGDRLENPSISQDRGALSRAKEQARHWRRQLGSTSTEIEPSRAGELVSLAYPDRIAQRRGPGSFKLSNGRGAVLPATDPLSTNDFLAVATLDGAGANAKIHLAAPLTLAEIETLFARQISTKSVIEWNSREKLVTMREERRLFELALATRPLKQPDHHQIALALLAGIRELGMQSLSWSDELQALRARVQFIRNLEPNSHWPDLSDTHLAATLEDWLAPFVQGITRANDFPKIDLNAAISVLLEWEKKRQLDQLVPTHVTVPSGSNIRIDYSDEAPILPVRLQELFGLIETPTIAGGKIALTLHLLSPARRPVQVTKDLKSFWANGYPEVKRDLKGRYPKHHWPDDPLTAIPTARAKPRGT